VKSENWRMVEEYVKNWVTVSIKNRIFVCFLCILCNVSVRFDPDTEAAHCFLDLGS